MDRPVCPICQQSMEGVEDATAEILALPCLHPLDKQAMLAVLEYILLSLDMEKVGHLKINWRPQSTK